jgi:hypothetical protein
MNVKDISKDIKAALYERVRSPFIGNFFLAWCFINRELLINLMFSKVDVAQKLGLLNTALDNHWMAWQKPILLTILLLVLLPSISIIVFSWQEIVSKIKKQIRYKLESDLLIPIETVRSLKSESSSRFSKYNDMIHSYELKIDKLDVSLIDKSRFLQEAQSSLIDVNDKLTKEQELSGHLRSEIFSNEKDIQNHNNEIEKYKNYDLLVEDGVFKQREIDNLKNYIKIKEIFTPSNSVVFDFPHMGKFEISRLVYEIQKLGLHPVFDGDKKGVSIEVPCYVDIDQVKQLGEKYRMECSTS